MQVSRKAVYAIKALIYVTAFKGKRLCTITEIAEKENIPREYLAKILKELTQKGFLASYKGVKGGYRLAKPGTDISFMDILEAVQDPLTLMETSGDGKLYDGASYRFWADLLEALRGKLSKMTLGKIEYSKFYPGERAESKKQTK